MARTAPLPLALPLAVALVMAPMSRPARGGVSREQVIRAIEGGVDFLKSRQQPNGAWPGQEGTTALVVLALLTAGEPANSPAVAAGVRYIAQMHPDRLNNTYAVALQAMALNAADPAAHRRLIAADASWLEQAQLRRNARSGTPGGWSYTIQQAPLADNSNSQYAMLGLNAAREAGVPIAPAVWGMAREYWESSQSFDGGWPYNRGMRGSSSASMTCAGISSMVIAEVNLIQTEEQLVGEEVRHCGRVSVNPTLQRGIDWMAANMRVDQNVGGAAQWKYYYLYGLERAGRLTGLRYFGDHDWYRQGAEQIVSEQDALSGGWGGDIHNTSFALLFLAKGRSPVLINKLRHGPGRDWDNDRDDVRNLVDVVSKDWGSLLTWQVVDPNTASVEDLLQAPILYFNGHEAPVFRGEAKRKLREYIEQGGAIVAEACCGREAFDRGFRSLMAEIFPEPEYELHPLTEEHGVWRSHHRLSPAIHPLWGIEHGCRTVVFYSPQDLSCFWNLMEARADRPKVIAAVRLGQNLIDYATGRELPADKLEVREVTKQAVDRPKRGALQIAKLRHGGEWNIAPMAIPNLTSALRNGPLKFDVVINHRVLAPRDPSLVNYPLVYIHGRAALSFSEEDLEALRRHLDPGGGTLFADAACGSESFDRAFRKFAAELLPGHPLEAIPPDDPICTTRVGFDLGQVQYSKAAGGHRGPPKLEGVKLNGHWALIYSKYDLGCALESHQGPDCKGYTHESALKISSNIVIYATLP